MKHKTINALIEMGVPADMKGFRYIVDIICMYSENEKMISERLMDVYQKVADMNEDKASRVERALRHAFSIALTKGDSHSVNKYLSLQYKSNGALLATLYYRLKMEELK